MSTDINLMGKRLMKVETKTVNSTLQKGGGFRLHKFSKNSTRMKSVLITGCNRGIGLGLVKQLLKLPTPPEHIITTCRDLAKAEALKEVASQNKNVHIIEIDVTHFDKYPDFVKQVDSIVGNDGLNVLINNAGIASKFTRVGLVKPEQMTEAFLVNTVAPVMLAKATIPLLKKASNNNSDLDLGTARAAIINISSLLGSISKNSEGGYYPYRCSKSALNSATKSLSIDLKDDKILVVSIHPGWIKTDMGGKNAPLEVEEAVEKIVETLKNLATMHNGQFVQYNGETLPW